MDEKLGIRYFFHDKNLFNSKLLYNNVIYNITKALQLKKDNNYIFEIFYNLSFLNYLHPDQNTFTHTLHYKEVL